jgi:hypothetical protein
MAVHLAPLLGSMCDGSKGSLGSKIGKLRRRLLPKLVASFNCGENRWRIKLTVTKGFGFCGKKIRLYR